VDWETALAECSERVTAVFDAPGLEAALTLSREDATSKFQLYTNLDEEYSLIPITAERAVDHAIALLLDTVLDGQIVYHIYMKRRSLIRSVAAIGTLAVAGCTGSDTEIVIGYGMEIKSHEEVPDEVVEHPNPEGFSWVVVQFELVSGSFDAADILGLTQVKVGGTSHFTRAVMITSPDSKLLASSSDRYTMEEGDTRESLLPDFERA